MARASDSLLLQVAHVAEPAEFVLFSTRRRPLCLSLRQAPAGCPVEGKAGDE